MVNLFSFGCHVINRAYASTDCTGGVGETIKRKERMSQACLLKSTSFILDGHSQYGQLTGIKTGIATDQHHMATLQAHVSTHRGDVIYSEAVN